MTKFYTLIVIFLFAGLTSLQAATFSSVTTGSWSAPGTWAVTGSDADGIPDQDDDVTINNGHTVAVSVAATFKSLLIASGGIFETNSKQISAYGNFTFNGTVNGNPVVQVWANSIFSGSYVWTNSGDWYVRSGTLTVQAGTSILKPYNNFIIGDIRTLINNGTMSIGRVYTYSSGVWQQGANSTLTININMIGNGSINASAAGNTVVYNNAGITQVKAATYYNLVINAASTKTLTGNTTVLNNFTMGTGTTNRLSLGAFSLTVGGNWTNNANSTLLNQGVVTFNGSGTQTISRASNEVIDNMVVAGTGTVALGRSITTQSITLNSGTLDVSASNFTVNVGSSFINNATFVPRQGTVIINGSTAAVIGGSSNSNFYGLTLNNAGGVTVNSAQSVSNVLTVTNGNFNSNGNVTLLSDATNTARIAQVGAGGSFAGNMTIQKFVSARPKGWHDLASPVVSTTIMDWDNEMYMSGIGADDGTPGPAGVDGSAGGFQSVYFYNEPSGYVAVHGSTTTIANGQGVEAWFADDQTNWFAKTVDTRGVPQVGPKTINLSYTASMGTDAGSALVGNPFASYINWSLVNKVNVNPNVLILDNSGNYNDYGASALIPPHQGFWAAATSSGASITIPESAKTTNTSTLHYRQAADYAIKLTFSTPLSPFYNESRILFNPMASTAFDNAYDAEYRKSPVNAAPALFMTDAKSKRFITNVTNSEADEQVIPLSFYTPTEGVYYIQPSVLSLNDYNYAWIENLKTGVTYPLDKDVAVYAKADVHNSDYVLHLSKKTSQPAMSQTRLENDLTVFGTEDNLNIKAQKNDHVITEIAIYDLSGKLVRQDKNLSIPAGNVIQIPIGDLVKGMYLVSITNEANQVLTKKIIR